MSGPITPPLTVETLDGATTGRPITTIKVSNGDLTVAGNVATIDTTGAGGGGTVTSISIKDTSGASSTAITTAGSFQFVGAGTTTTSVTGTILTVTSNDQFVGTVTGVTSFAPLAVDNSNPAIPSIAMPQSTSGQDGWLSSTDWNTFNNKGTGTINGSILNTQVARGANTINEIEGSNGLLFDGTSLTVSTLSLSNPIINMSSTTKSVSLEVETSQTLSIKGGSNKFIFDASTATSGITWPDGSSQITANNTVGTVTGTGSTNQVSYWTTASAQAGSTGLTYDPSTGDLTVGGYVESGTGKFTTDSGSTDLTLDTNDGAGSSGSIVIEAGGNGQISINPHGTGTVKIDGVEIDNTAIATGYVLKATSTTAAGWVAESGGGGGTIGGSIANQQVARGATTADEIEGDNGLLFDGTSFTVNTLSANNPVLNMSSSTKSVSLEVETSQTLSIKGGSNKFIFDASTATSGITFPDGTTQITAASGGGGSSLTPRFSGVKANSNAYYDLSAYPTGWRTRAYTNYLESQSAPIWCPFTCGIDLTVSTLGIQVSTAGAAGLKYLLGIYSTLPEGLPNALLVKSEVLGDVTGTQAATVTETTAGDADLVAGVQYWYCYTRNTQSPSSYATLRSGSFEFTGNITDSSIGSQRQSIRSGTTGTLPLTYSGSGAPIGNANAIVGCTYA